MDIFGSKGDVRSAKPSLRMDGWMDVIGMDDSIQSLRMDRWMEASEMMTAPLAFHACRDGWTSVISLPTDVSYIMNNDSGHPPSIQNTFGWMEDGPDASPDISRIRLHTPALGLY